jgi:AhpD family alkylhydroperoxidase
MSERLDYRIQSPDLFKKLGAFSAMIAHGAIEASTIDLVFLRASQLNGCSFCVDMHSKQATIRGERPLRLYAVAAWRDATLFSPRERAALEWTEVLTHLPSDGVPDAIYERVRAQFSEKEISDLTFAIMSINAWNRANIAFRTVPGTLDKEYGLDKANLA